MKKLVIILTICLFSVGINAQQAASNGEWHILLVAATLDKDVGTAVQTSLSDAKANFTQLAQVMGLTPKITVIEGMDFTAPNVVSAVQELILTPKPASGKFMATMMSFNHGVNFKNTWTQLPFMLCNPTNNIMQSKDQLVSIEDIYESLRTKSQFEHIHVWSELCNSIPNGFNNAPNSVTLTSRTMKGGDQKSNLEKLLYGVKSEIMISSSYGQASYTSDQGGAFSNSVFAAISEVMIGQKTAQFDGNGGVFENVKQNTQIAAVNIANMSKVRQTPQCFLDKVPGTIPQAQSNFSNIANHTGNTPAAKDIDLKFTSPLDHINGIYSKTSVQGKKTKTKAKAKSKSGASW